MFQSSSAKHLYRVAALCLSLLSITVNLFAAGKKEAALTFSCAADNDLFVSLAAAGELCPRFSSVSEALNSARPDSAVLVLADNYPATTPALAAADFELAAKKNLHLFLEYPAAVPGLEVGQPRTTVWERGVVASDDFGTNLPRLRILAMHDCHYLPVTNVIHPLLVVARVAGFDTAIFGLPTNAQPILFEIPGRNLFIATTRLSGFIRNRFAPAQDWNLIWRNILSRLDPKGPAHALAWRPAVAPVYSQKAKMPNDFERIAFASYIGWIARSRLMVSPMRKTGIEKALASGGETIEMPGPEASAGDGSLGILEGYASGIQYDGRQLQRLPLRADCNAEIAMVLSLAATLHHNSQNVVTASNLLDYVYFNSDICQFERADSKNGAYGLIGWGAIAPAWRVANYGDDNANAMLSTMLAGSTLHNARWDEMLLRALLANLRTTGRLGFRGDRVDLPGLAQGWRQYHDAATINYSPHFESFLWACNLWAYRQTGFEPFFSKATNAIAMTMKVYPDGWRWKNNLERAHMLLCLSWLVRVADTPEHRQWLKTVADDLLKYQSSSGAIYETLIGTGGGHYQVPQSNEAYGTTETPLIQQNGDPASDQLYTTGYALLGLHEAVGATDDPTLKKAEDRLAEFLCRIQIRSQKFPWLEGTWFRAFDDRRWEFWASSADAGWGAWSAESGWSQAWTAATLGLRQKKITFWEATANPRLRDMLPTIKAQFSTNDADF